MFITLDREYEVKCTLGTIRDIERSFGKSFFDIVGNISSMTTDQQMKLLYLGAKKADPTLSQEVFFAQCEENLGIGEFMEMLERFFYSLQYPGLSEEEVPEKIEKKLAQNQALQQKKDSIGKK